MSDQLEWRERLESAHKQMQDAMTEMITKKDYSEAERARLGGHPPKAPTAPGHSALRSLTSEGNKLRTTPSRTQLGVLFCDDSLRISINNCCKSR
jgi:hypothetical protein